MVAIEPVVFDPYSIEFFDDPFPTYDRLREEAPVYRNEHYGFWALSRYQDVLDASLNWQVFSSAHGSLLSDLTNPDYQPGGRIINIDPPQHNRFRALVSRAFSPRGIARMEDVVREVIDSVLRTLEGRTNFDLVGEFSAIFPNEIISTILGIPALDRSQIRQWTDDILHREEGTDELSARTVQAFADQIAYFKHLSGEKRRRPGDDMITALVDAEVEDGVGSTTRLTDDEIADFAFVLGAAGTETVTKLVANAAVLLDRHRAQRELLLADKGRIPAAVDEVLRYWAPSHLQGRFTTSDVTIDGMTIPKSSPVFLITGSANRDPRAYPDPDRFDIARTDLPVALGFGFGAHYCIGAALARTESRLALSEMLTRWPDFTIDETGLERVHMANVAGFSRVPFSVHS
jgi:cytochrome P450